MPSILNAVTSKLKLPEFPAYTYSRARSAGLTFEFFLLNSLSLLMPASLRKSTSANRSLRDNLELHRAVHADMLQLLRNDSKRIEAGVYPLSVLTPESPIEHVARYPKLIKDAFSIYFRRVRGRTTEFDPEAKELLSDLPRYYRRNFHFQTNGYLSTTSAEVYEHQVELLFKGAADPMRRLIIEPLRERFGDTDGEGLRFLEIGAGTGRATRFVRLAFPKAKVVAVDLSDPYLKVAQRKLSDLAKIDFIQSDGAHLPYREEEFDAAYSVFLFHELPAAARKEIIEESLRVLKFGGFFGLVDSIQTGDKKHFDPILREFPQEFHEPFYRDYIAHPMDDLLKSSGVENVRKELGFTSKVCWGRKTTGAKPKKPSTRRVAREARSN
ncbi:MAG: class I SAM-dependent methyltransferase [Oligoflexia bacterium]|nr:class I SAM-dependent methyltransferase [Oligoflexia bacterium]